MDKVSTGERFIRLRQVQAKTGIARATIYQKIKDGKFPEQVNVGPRCVVWVESEIEQWMQSRILESRK